MNQKWSTMVSLKDINPDSYHQVAGLRITEEQSEFVPPAVNIMARAYAWRNKNSSAYAIYSDDTIIGIVMIGDDIDCYELHQFLIDSSYQKKGYGKQAVRLIIDRLSHEHKYDCIKLSVIKKNEAAIHLYKSMGFIDAKYTDPKKPNSFILIYNFH